MSWRKTGPALLTCVALLFMAGNVLAQDAEPQEAKPRAAGEDALAKVQGKWQRDEPSDSPADYRRAQKHIQGNRETVSYLNASGQIVRQHRVNFRLEKMGDVNIFTYTDMEIIAGPQKGTKMPGPVSYIYAVGGTEDRYFREVSGFLPGQENRPAAMYTWKKVLDDRGEAGLAAATEKPENPPAADDKKKALEGTWHPIKAVQGGQPEPQDENDRYRVKFEGENFTITRDGQALMKGTFTLDAEKKPNTIDMKVNENTDNPDDVGKTLLGIIEVSGDELKWCFVPPDRGERPGEFESPEGTPRMLVTFKREKKE